MKCYSAKLSQLFTCLFVLTFPDPFQSVTVFVSWVEVPTEMPTSPIMSDLEVDDTARDTKRSCDL